MSVLTCCHILLQVELSKEELQHIIAEAKEQLGLVEFLDDLLDITFFVCLKGFRKEHWPKWDYETETAIQTQSI